ncbi:MAG: hypothetical protein LBT46_15280 [Planctomycetaceae bacterium]|jgi:hypothetical protein|nr:hypothetical protein [Planctomycetaceae bacterium]
MVMTLEVSDTKPFILPTELPTEPQPEEEAEAEPEEPQGETPDGVVKEPMDGLDPEHELSALRNFHKHVIEATKEIEDAKIAASEAGKLVKELRELLEEYVEVHRNIHPQVNAETHPLLFAGTEQDNWRDKPIDLLAVTDKDKEKLYQAGFVTCGEIADWLSKDWVEKKQGCNGKVFQDRLRDAVNKISGVDKMPIITEETAA